MDALLIVDVSTNEGWKPTLEEMSGSLHLVGHAIVNVLKEWRAKNGLVCMVTFPSLHLQKVPTQFMHGTTPVCIGCDSVLAPLAPFLKHQHGADFEPVFLKTTTNAFDHPVLRHHLYAKEVTRVFLAGCTTFGCMQDTAKGAVHDGFSVVLYDRCTYPPFKDGGDRYQWLEDVRAESEIGATVELL